MSSIASTQRASEPRRGLPPSTVDERRCPPLYRNFDDIPRWGRSYSCASVSTKRREARRVAPRRSRAYTRRTLCAACPRNGLCAMARAPAIHRQFSYARPPRPSAPRYGSSVRQAVARCDERARMIRNEVADDARRSCVVFDLAPRCPASAGRVRPARP